MEFFSSQINTEGNVNQNNNNQGSHHTLYKCNVVDFNFATIFSEPVFVFATKECILKSCIVKNYRKNIKKWN